jgi:hypothetical protein
MSQICCTQRRSPRFATGVIMKRFLGFRLDRLTVIGDGSVKIALKFPHQAAATVHHRKIAAF